MALLFCSRDIEDGALLGKVHKACEDQRCTNRYSVFGYAAVKEAFGEIELPSALSESLIFSSNIAPLITEGLKGNPRQVKRFLNAYFLRKELAKVRSFGKCVKTFDIQGVTSFYRHMYKTRLL